MITYRLARDNELALAFQLALRRRGLAQPTVRRRADALLAVARRQGLDARGAWLAERGGAAISACAQLTSPGQAATVVIPSCEDDAGGPAVAGELLLRMRNRLTQQGILLQQVLVPEDEPERAESEAILKQANFAFLAELLYLDLALADRPPLSTSPPEQFTWVAYGRQTHDRFAAVIEGTYEGSLDCPGLAGRRPIDDVLASHRAAGVFHPHRWLLAERGGRSAGCLLMSRALLTSALEVVYMGLLPWARRRGWGPALLIQAEQLARHAGVDRVTLAVDKSNTPAMRLYTGYGFVLRHRRHAWIFSPPRTTH